MRRHTHHVDLFVLCVSLIFTAVCRAESPDLSSPKSAEKAYHIAENSGDVDALKAVTIFDEKWAKVIEARAVGSREQIKLQKAVREKWGEASKQAFPDFKSVDVPGAVERIDGDVAQIVYHGTVVSRLKRVDGKWKVDLVTPISDMEMDGPAEQLKAALAYDRAAVDATKLVTENKCSSPEDAHHALDEAFETEYTGVKQPSTRNAATQP